ncbi:hypothetical protein LCGC14_0714580 [marine sediment metagenome]|uniref:Uncharacterized protein n=1 Tax=marine sediment metagenome TaxID=412755 RepID=A0A0F9QIK1_9ZZZZ|nr:hypothetical protein [Phycisphaerae bacterium]
MGTKSKQIRDTTTLQAATTTAAGAIDTTGSAVGMGIPLNGFVFVLDVTAAATDVGDLLDVSVETRIDDGVGATWHQVVHFTQVLGDGGAKQFVEKITSARIEAGYESGTALGAGLVRNLIGDEWRVAWVQVDADSDATFTFSVTACPM